VVLERPNKPKQVVLVECDSSVYLNRENNTNRSAKDPYYKMFFFSAI
jgi:hypothetical protein